MNVLKSQIRADHLNIEIDQAPLTSNKQQQLKLYNILTLFKKIQLLYIVGVFLVSIITNFIYIASSVQILCTSNSTCQCPQKL